MFTVYVLRSKKNGKLYSGITEREIELRLQEHNSNGLKWTSGRGPFEIVYKETYTSEELARKRERFFKTGKGRQGLKNRLS